MANELNFTRNPIFRKILKYIFLKYDTISEYELNGKLFLFDLT